MRVGKRFETKLDDCDLVLYFYLDENSVGFSLAAVADREPPVKGKNQAVLVQLFRIRLRLTTISVAVSSGVI